MKLLTPFIVMMRSRQLARQLRGIERSLVALPERSRARMSMLALREIDQASRSEYPHLYGTAPEARYLPWGQGTEAGYERACSNNPEVAMRGIALWMAVAYHETRNSNHPRLQPSYRRVMQLLGEMKQVAPASDTVDSWMQTSQAA